MDASHIALIGCRARPSLRPSRVLPPPVCLCTPHAVRLTNPCGRAPPHDHNNRLAPALCCLRVLLSDRESKVEVQRVIKSESRQSEGPKGGLEPFTSPLDRYTYMLYF